MPRLLCCVERLPASLLMLMLTCQGALPHRRLKSYDHPMGGLIARLAVAWHCVAPN